VVCKVFQKQSLKKQRNLSTYIILRFQTVDKPQYFLMLGFIFKPSVYFSSILVPIFIIGLALSNGSIRAFIQAI